MGEPRHHCKLWLLVLALAQWLHASTGATTTFTIANYCAYPIWPGTLAGSGTPQLSPTGFELGPGQAVRLAAPPGWSGRMWARTGCVFDAAGAGVCQTGDCGGRMECRGAGATPPATLFEVTLGKGGGEDFYDVSLVDGYNLPVVAIPRALRGPGACNATGCLADLNRSCPTELRVDYGGGPIACRSACEAFGQDRYCCSGAYGTPAACRPTSYSSVFKMACPRAYSYAYDDSTSTFTCSADDYTVAFCLPTTGIKESDAVFLGAQIIGGRGTGAAEANDIAPPAYGNGGAGAYPPPPYDSHSGGGAGGAYLPPVYNYGPGGDRIPPAMRISSACTATTTSTRTYIRPWLPLLLLLCFA
ncbi:hypothetical protein ACQJBY_044640 [Aegilops geniculata]